MNAFCPMCDVSLDLHDGDDSCHSANGKANILALFGGPFLRLREDTFTNTVDDAGRYERERTRDAGEDDRPALADCGDF